MSDIHLIHPLPFHSTSFTEGVKVVKRVEVQRYGVQDVAVHFVQRSCTSKNHDEEVHIKGVGFILCYTPYRFAKKKSIFRSCT